MSLSEQCCLGSFSPTTVGIAPAATLWLHGRKEVVRTWCPEVPVIVTRLLSVLSKLPVLSLSVET